MTTYPAGTLQQIPPTDLALLKNIRTSVDLTPDFIDSIKTNGVITPVIAAYDVVGQLAVLDGQRRVAAAVEAAVPTIPVVVIDPPGDEADRIISQDAVNHHRAAVAAADQAAAFEELALFGMSPEKIAKRTGRTVDHVASALKVAKRTDLQELAAPAGLDLTRLARLAALEDTGQVSDRDLSGLIEIASEEGVGAFDHELKEVEDTAERDVLVAAIREALTARGVTVLDRSEYNTKHECRDLSNLRDDEGAVIDPDTHVSCEGHAAVLPPRWSVDVTVAPEDLDAHGVFWVCVDRSKYGHRLAWERVVTAEEQASADEHTQREQEHRAKVRAAEEVREDFLRQLVNRTPPPKGAAIFAVETLQHLTGTGYIRLDQPELLAPETVPYEDGNDDEAGEFHFPTQHSAISYLFAVAVERMHSGASLNHLTRREVEYLMKLVEWGYTLSDVETEAIRAYTARVTAALQVEAAQAEYEADGDNDEDPETDE